MTVTKRTRARSWTIFERRFRPIIRPDTPRFGNSPKCVRPRRPTVRHWWTVIDCAGGLYLSAGFRFVNRLCYVRCEVPWTDADARIDYRYD